MPYTPPTFASPLLSATYRTATADVVDYVRSGFAAGTSVIRTDLARQTITPKGSWGHAWRGVSGCGEYRTPPPTFHTHAWEWQPVPGYTVRLPLERQGVVEVAWQLRVEVGPDDAPSRTKPTVNDRETRLGFALGGTRYAETTGSNPQNVIGFSSGAAPEGAEQPYEIVGGGWVGGTYRAAVNISGGGGGTLSLALVMKSQVDRVLIPEGTMLASLTYGA